MNTIQTNYDEERRRLRERLDEVRARSLHTRDELGEAVQRLGDWREHVRAHPWITASAAALIGGVVAKTAVTAIAHAWSARSGAKNTKAVAKTTASAAPATVMGAGMALASQLAKRWAMQSLQQLAVQQLSSWTEGKSHDRSQVEPVASRR